MNQKIVESPVEVQKELLELMIKAGRRCAYDLRHAADNVSDPFLRSVFRESADHWLTVFNPANDSKNYRSRLHKEIYDLEILVDKLSKLAIEHGASQQDIDYIKHWGTLD